MDAGTNSIFILQDLIPAAEVENEVFKRLSNAFSNENFIKTVVKQINKDRNIGKRQLNIDQNHIIKQVVALDGKLNHWFNAFETGKIEAELVETRIIELETEKKQLSERLNQIAKELEQDEVQPIPAELITSLLSRFDQLVNKAMPKN